MTEKGDGKTADDKDLQLIRILAENSRTSLSDLATSIGLSPPSVRDRLVRLEEIGIIRRYTLALDEKKLGLGVTAFVLITLSDHTQKDRVLAALTRIPEIIECHHIAGEENFLIKVKTASIATLEELLTKILVTGQAIARTRTLIVLSTSMENRPLPLSPRSLEILEG